MHIDLAHAAVASVLIILTLWVLRASGIVTEEEARRHRWNWKIFSAIFVMMFLLNLIWSYG